MDSREQRVSVVTPLEQAWARMVRLLFSPWELGKWLALGFIMFLVYLNSTVAKATELASHLLPMDGLFPMPTFREPFADFLLRTREHYTALAIAAVCVGLVVYAVMTFFGSRARFMLLDAMVHNRADIAEPWRAYAGPANRLWIFLVVITTGFWLVNCIAVAVGVMVVWPDIQAGFMGDRTYWTLIVATCTLPMLWLLYFKGLVITWDFIVPMMMAQKLGPWRAWWVWLRDFLRYHMWAIVLFYLLRMVISSVVGTLAFFACCLTCSVAAWPYVESVALLPILVFDRLYAAYFVGQFGPGWVLFQPEPDEPPLCPGCRYDLRGNPAALSCPECGYDLTERPTFATGGGVGAEG